MGGSIHVSRIQQLRTRLEDAKGVLRGIDRGASSDGSRNSLGLGARDHRVGTRGTGGQPAVDGRFEASQAEERFAHDGVVLDEGREYRGRHAVRQWKAAANAKYQYVLETVNVRTLGDLVTVRARLTGEFPGSPVELDHIFKRSNDKIASLEIRL